MSTLNVANISDGTDTVETGYVVNGSAKAWVNFDGTGTIAIRDSLNVTDLFDNGLGNYDVFYTNSLANVNYSYVTTTSNGASLRASTLSVLSVSSATYRASTSISGYIVSSSYTDNNKNNCVIHGDLA